MSWTTYTTVNGQILHQEKDGVGTHLIPDTLGNIIATIDEAGTVTSRTDYLPYGEVESQTGTNPTPFGFVGAWGYYNDSEATIYIRARTYSPVMAAWATSDPLWPEEIAYAYGSESPVQTIDPTGLWTPKPGKDVLNCAKQMVGSVCSYTGTPEQGLACVEVFSICAGIKPRDVPQPCNHGGPSRDCPRSTDDVCRLLKGKGLYHRSGWQPNGKPCKPGDAICFSISWYRPKAPCGGHCGVISRIDSKGRPTHAIMCSAMCTPADTVCEVSISDWIRNCKKGGHSCGINGCGGSR
jgi:RHS repeat-associated protein